MGLSEKARKELKKPGYGSSDIVAGGTPPDMVICDLTEAMMTPAGERVRTVQVSESARAAKNAAENLTLAPPRRRTSPTCSPGRSAAHSPPVRTPI